MIFFSYACRVMWQSTSMCLVRLRKTGLDAMAMALLLSQCIGIGVLMEIPISERKSHNQWISKVVSAIARYSASVLDRETTSCLLLRQNIRQVPKKMQYPMVERRVSGSSAQPASE